MSMRGKLFIVSAPSGAGKTTVIKAVLERVGLLYKVERVVTYTTKPIQPGEKPGVDYHYLSEADFLNKIEAGFFIEWSAAYGYYYGSPLSILDGLEQGVSYIAILDRAGAKAVIDRVPEAVLIWLTIGSIEILRSRLVGRARDEADAIERRLLLAQKELDEEKKEPLFQYHVLNDEFERAVFSIDSIVRNALA